MGAIEEIYEDLDADVSEEEFREAVEEKVEQMGGLADEETAAMLIAHELADREVSGIADIEPGMEEVKFLGKVISVGEVREFERDGEDEDGRVVNVDLADETSSIRAAFWDEMAASATGELEAGQVLRVQGRPREGYNGLEVSVDHAEPDEDATIDVDLTEEYDIADLSMGLSDVTLRGRVLATESVRTFDRDDGSEGRVANLVLGDETGRLRVTLWDERADLAEAFDPGESVEVIDGYVRERDGDLELHVGDRGTVERIEETIEYVPEATDIDAVEMGQTVDIAGVVRSADPKRTFDRDDGSEGQVRNIRIQDDTGDIRVALWGEKADIDVAPGDEVQVADVEIEDGWQDDLEASANWRSTVTVLDDGATAVAAEDSTDEGEDDGSAPGLDAFADDEAPDAPDSGDGEPVEFTGVVVQAGDPIVLDDGQETVSVEADADVELGEEITVRGTRSAGRLDATEIE
ncbi:MAG: single-stranded DNA binding protein [Halobacteriales archaeon]